MSRERLQEVQKECHEFFSGLIKKYDDIEFCFAVTVDSRVHSGAHAKTFGSMFWMTEIIRDSAKERSRKVAREETPSEGGEG